MGSAVPIAAAAVGGAASGLAGGSSKSGETRPAFYYYPQWLKDILQTRAIQPTDDIIRAHIGQFKGYMGKVWPSMREKLNENYAIRGLGRSGFLGDAMRKSYEAEAQQHSEFAATLPALAESIRNARLSMVTGAQNPIIQQPSQPSMWGSALSGAIGGAGSMLYNQGLQAALTPSSVSQAGYYPFVPSPSYGPLNNPSPLYDPKYFGTYK